MRTSVPRPIPMYMSDLTGKRVGMTALLFPAPPTVNHRAEVASAGSVGGACSGRHGPRLRDRVGNARAPSQSAGGSSTGRLTRELHRASRAARQSSDDRIALERGVRPARRALQTLTSAALPIAVNDACRVVESEQGPLSWECSRFLQTDMRTRALLFDRAGVGVRSGEEPHELAEVAEPDGIGVAREE
jgi:hypothetical protein